MTKRNIKSTQGVITIYQLKYDRLWQFHGLTDFCWLVLILVGLVLIRVDSCRNRVDSCWLVSGSCWLVSDSCWFVLTRVDSCWLVLVLVHRDELDQRFYVSWSSNKVIVSIIAKKMINLFKCFHAQLDILS